LVIALVHRKHSSNQDKLSRPNTDTASHGEDRHKHEPCHCQVRALPPPSSPAHRRLLPPLSNTAQHILPRLPVRQPACRRRRRSRRPRRRPPPRVGHLPPAQGHAPRRADVVPQHPQRHRRAGGRGEEPGLPFAGVGRPAALPGGPLPTRRRQECLRARVARRSAPRRGAPAGARVRVRDGLRPHQHLARAHVARPVRVVAREEQVQGARCGGRCSTTAR
jgi:hypothetical protein